VLTVHDLIYYRNRTPPRDLAAPIRLLWRLYHLAWWPQRMLLNRADGVVTVSNTTAALIAEHDLTRKPVTVVSNAAAPLAALDSDSDDALTRREAPTVRRLVYMGSYMPYKNVDTLVRAVATLPGTELHLMSRVSGAERVRLQKLAPSALLVFHDGATDAEYAETLRSATALVTASRDEGFGIPLVESMRLGTPVVVSDIPIFREIGGDAALYFDVDDPRALAAAVTRLDEPEEWQRRSALGLERAATFTWAASARTLLGVLEETVARRRDR